LVADIYFYQLVFLKLVVQEGKKIMKHLVRFIERIYDIDCRGKSIK